MTLQRSSRKDFPFDVFLSHSRKDQETVSELADRLRSGGLTVWLDVEQIQPGDAIPLKVNEGLKQSRNLVMAWSRDFAASEWTLFESNTFRFRDPNNTKGRKFIPVLLDDHPVDESLAMFANVDWRQQSTSECQRMIKVCLPTDTSQAQPDVQHQTQPTVSDVPWLRSIGLGHLAAVNSVAFSPDGKQVLSGSSDHTLRLWDTALGECINTLEGHKNGVNSVAFSPDGKQVLSGSSDHTLRLWDTASGACINTLEGHNGTVTSVAFSPDGKQVLSGSSDNTLRLWDTASGACINTLEGHNGTVLSVAFSPDGKQVLSGSDDRTLRLWDTASGECINTLEGHKNGVNSVAFSPDGKQVLSGSSDHTLRLWDTASGECINTFEGHNDLVVSVTFGPDGTIWSAIYDCCLRQWPNPASLEQLADAENRFTSYTNAKVLIVGDSGVGKSGLTQRLTTGQFVHTDSTDAHQITKTDDEWATRVRLQHDNEDHEVDREIWLWDFAGQHDYRLIHQLFMDEAAMAVLVFNPQAENPYEGIGNWDRDLRKAARRDFERVLVAGRMDRGGLMVSHDRLVEYAMNLGYCGFVKTSASTGEGCEELKSQIIENIPWDRISHRTSPVIFKRLKDEIIRMRDEGIVLLRMSELKQQLQIRLAGCSNSSHASDEKEGASAADSFTIEQLRTVVGLLAGPGLVWMLEFGDFVLLKPELINSYAAAVIRKVRKHVDEIGSIREQQIFDRDLEWANLQRLPEFEEDMVLRAMHQTFIDHGLCLRETSPDGPVLVFPSCFSRERPPLKRHPNTLVTYEFEGPLDEIYATLVVRLHYTRTFQNDTLWRYAADFGSHAGKRLGFRMIKKGEGVAEITVYMEVDIPIDTQVEFVSYIHEHLQRRATDESVRRIRHYLCPHCGEAVENRRAIEIRLQKKQRDILCGVCEQRVPLMDELEDRFGSSEAKQRVQEMNEAAQAGLDNESKELILVGHAFSIAGEAGQIFRPVANSDWGIDGEIEFKDQHGNASGRRVYLQLKSGDSYLRHRKRDDAHVLRIKNERQAEYWVSHEYPVMLVIRRSDGEIRWMNATAHLKRLQDEEAESWPPTQIEFDGEPFTALNLRTMRDSFFPVE